MVAATTRRRLRFPGATAGLRRGITPAEVLVIVAVAAASVLLVLISLLRQRESARSAGCQRNLMQIGVALVLYDKAEGCLPTVPALSADPPPRGGPLKALLDALVLPDLTGLTDPSKPSKPRPGQVPGERPVPGFVCPSDRDALSGMILRAPVSYRGTAGDDPAGTNGGFAPGRTITPRTVDEADGLAYTAAFSERLVGRGKVERPTAVDYQIVSGPLIGSGCPGGSDGPWRGDAGTSWAEPSWRSTLYNHVLAPGGAPSCVTGDGSEGVVGASSGHTAGVNVLHFDGHVATITPRVGPPVWKALATTHTEDPTPTMPKRKPR